MSLPDLREAEPTELIAGRVIASHGRHVLVETANGSRHPCTLFGRRLDAVCGDEVRWHPDEKSARGVVVERLPRRTWLARSDSRGRSEVLVTNLSQLVVVSAGLPKPDFFVIDRYLAAGESSGIRCIVVLNKIDLAESRDAMRELEIYAAIGYPTLECGALSNAGIEDLHRALRDQVSVLVGQSGVGKSSLANRLLPGLNAETAELSRATVEGRHITSVATLHRLPEGGAIVDSPGVRDFAPALDNLSDPAAVFREFREPASHCRFADCRHLKEPDCAVRAALEAGTISPRRYESYRRLARLHAHLAKEREARRRS